MYNLYKNIINLYTDKFKLIIYIIPTCLGNKYILKIKDYTI